MQTEMENKRVMQRVLCLLAVIIMASSNAYAYFLVNKIAYEPISDNTVKVTYIDDDATLGWIWDDDAEAYVYAGDIEIPSTVENGGKTYTVTSLDTYAFYGCKELGDVVLPSTVVNIGQSVFYGAKCKSLTINGELESIGVYAFNECEGIEEVKLANTLTEIPEGAFQKSTLRSIEIPSSVKTIVNFAFYSCENLKSVTLSEGLKTIGQEVFCHCGFNEITLPSTLETIGIFAFEYCNIEKIVIPNSVKSIEKQAFQSCHYLKSVKLPENSSYTTIKDGTFQYCSSLEKLVIPANVTTIEKEAFRNSSSLLFVKSNATTPPTIDANAFYDEATKKAVTGNVSLFVPTGTAETYQAAAVWKDFKSISDAKVVTASLSATPVGCGRVMGEGFFATGVDIGIAAFPNNKYKFVKWEYDSGLGLTMIATDANPTIRITQTLVNYLDNKEKGGGSGSLELTAVFEKIHYNLDIHSSNSYGKVSVDGVEGDVNGSYEIDYSCVVTAVPNEGCRFLRFEDSEGNTITTPNFAKDKYKVDLYTSMTVVAVFEEIPHYTVALTVEGEDYGQVTGASDDGRYLEGSNVSLTAVKKDNCVFLGWTLDGTDMGADDTNLKIDNIADNHTVVAKFKEMDKSTLTLAVKDNVGGTVTLDGEAYTTPLTKYTGNTAQLAASAAEHYTFTKWVVTAENADPVDNTNSSVIYTFDATNDTYTAVFTEDAKYTIKVTTNMAEASDLEAKEYVIYYNESQNIGFTVNEGYEFVRWDIKSGDDVIDTKKDENQEIHPTKDVEYAAVFKMKEYNVKANAVENGTLTLSTDKATFGTEVTVTATPAEDYELETLTTDVEGLTITSGKFIMPKKDVNVSATFKKLDYHTITVAAVENGTVSASAAKALADETITLDVKANDGYKIGTVKVNDTEIELADPITFKMGAENVTVTVTFAKLQNYAVKTEVEGKGTVKVSGNDVKEGEKVTISTVAAAGYKLESLTSEDVEIAKDSTFVMPEKAVTVKAKFTAIPYNIKISGVKNGNVKADKQTAIVGEEVTFTVTANPGYEFKELLVDNTPIKGTKYVMPAKDITVSATFDAIGYAVSIADTKNGNVSVSAESATVGQKIEITATPDAGYEVESITTDVEGLTIKDNTFTMPAQKVEVKVTFKAIEYSVTVKSTANGKLTPSTTKATIGQEITLTASPNDGYKLGTIKLPEGIELSEFNTFIMPAKNVEVSATFVEREYYAVEVKTDGNGKINASTNDAQAGVEVTITTEANEGYELLDVTTDVEGLKVTDGKFIMPAQSVTVTATFRALNFNLAVGETKNGAITLSAATAKVGEEIVVTATPEVGYELSKITTSDKDVEVVNGKFLMPAKDITVTASFKAIEYSIKLNETQNGKATLSAGKGTIGEEITVGYEPATNYELDQILVNGEAISGDKFTIKDADVVVTVTFKENLCIICNKTVPAKSLYDWIIMIDKNKLVSEGYSFQDQDVEWYRVVGEQDEWCEGEQFDIDGADTKVKSGLYFTEDNSLIGTGDYYAVIRLAAGQKCKTITSDVISYSANKNLRLTPTSVRHGQTLTLTGLPEADATVQVFNMYGKQVKMIKTDGAEQVTFEAENIDGVYIVNVTTDEMVKKSIKYVVK